MSLSADGKFLEVGLEVFFILCDDIRKATIVRINGAYAEFSHHEPPPRVMPISLLYTSRGECLLGLSLRFRDRGNALLTKSKQLRAEGLGMLGFKGSGIPAPKEEQTDAVSEDDLHNQQFKG